MCLKLCEMYNIGCWTNHLQSSLAKSKFIENPIHWSELQVTLSLAAATKLRPNNSSQDPRENLENDKSIQNTYSLVIFVKMLLPPSLAILNTFIKLFRQCVVIRNKLHILNTLVSSVSLISYTKEVELFCNKLKQIQKSNF